MYGLLEVWVAKLLGEAVVVELHILVVMSKFVSQVLLMLEQFLLLIR